MAKRLSKALRGKRRWVGIECLAQFESRSSFEKHLSEVLHPLEDTKPFRLMDFHPAHSEVAIAAVSALGGIENHGFAILEIPHSEYQSVRQFIESEDSLLTHGIRSITSSGKIRLVRERLAIPRPKRNR